VTSRGGQEQELSNGEEQGGAGWPGNQGGGKTRVGGEGNIKNEDSSKKCTGMVGRTEGRRLDHGKWEELKGAILGVGEKRCGKDL